MSIRSKSTWRFLRAAVLSTVVALTGALLLDAGSAFAASNVGAVSFSGATQAAGAATTWTIGFSTDTPAGSALSGASGNNQIFVTFNSAFGLPASPSVTLVSGFSSCTATASRSGSVVTVTLAGGSCALPKSTPAQLTLASITNPAASSYAASTFSVRTSNDSAASPTSNVVIFGTATKLAFSTPPSGAVSGTAFTTQPVVTVQDANGNTVANNTSSVTLSISGSPAGVSLTCTANPKAAASGVATFAGCQIDKAGTYTLTATDGALTAAVSSSITVATGAANKVVFSVQPPAAGTAGTALTTFRAAVQDAAGNTVTSGTGSTDAITLSIATGPAGGTFNSAATTFTNVAAVAGVASFSAVVLNTAGSYTFTATDSTRTLTTATSTPATAIAAAAAAKLAFAQGPTESQAGSPLTPTVTVQVQDQFGNPATAGGVTVTLSSSAGPLDAGASASTNGSGLASFGSAQINTAATGLTLTASATGLTSVTSASFNVVVQVSNNAPLTDAAADPGSIASGVQSVSYYYCAGGFTGACTIATGTLIGTATSAATNYLVNWTGQPANGQYRLIAVATDNVTNVGSPSATIPVRVAN
jgi:hypothetical protein